MKACSLSARRASGNRCQRSKVVGLQVLWENTNLSVTVLGLCYFLDGVSMESKGGNAVCKAVEC